MKSANYYNTFIEVSDDCPVSRAEIPASRGGVKTVPQLQYEMIAAHPYHYTQDDVLFETYAIRNNIDKNDRREREKFFSKGQPCFRASPLGKRYGWGVHCDEEGRVALYAVESEEYRKFKNDQNLNHLKAVKTSRSK